MSASDRYIRHVSVLIKLVLSVILEITSPLHSVYTATLIQSSLWPVSYYRHHVAFWCKFLITDGITIWMYMYNYVNVLCDSTIYAIKCLSMTLWAIPHVHCFVTAHNNQKWNKTLQCRQEYILLTQEREIKEEEQKRACNIVIQCITLYCTLYCM